MGIKSLISAWYAFVESVLSGYGFSIYDYENDLSIRDRIEDEISKGVVIDSRLKAALDSSDIRLRKVLIPLERPLRSAPSSSWWYIGVPSTALEVVNDARAQGLLSVE